MPYSKDAGAFEFMDAAKDVGSLGAAFMTHLFIHEMGHQIVADDVGASSHKMQFFANRNGKFYLGFATYESIPDESVLPYAVGGVRMADITFEHALQSYRRKPTMFNKSLIFFSSVNFLAYTLLANYVEPGEKTYDPNLIRDEIGFSKEEMLSLVATKTLLNAYRITDPDANYHPFILFDKKRAAFIIQVDF